MTSTESSPKKRRIMIITADESLIDQIQKNGTGSILKSFVLDSNDDDVEISHSKVTTPPSTSNAKKAKTSSLTCVVCGSIAYGYNFDAITCESCKAFFRRNAMKDPVRVVIILDCSFLLVRTGDDGLSTPWVVWCYDGIASSLFGVSIEQVSSVRNETRSIINGIDRWRQEDIIPIEDTLGRPESGETAKDRRESIVDLAEDWGAKKWRERHSSYFGCL